MLLQRLKLLYRDLRGYRYQAPVTPDKFEPLPRIVRGTGVYLGDLKGVVHFRGIVWGRLWIGRWGEARKTGLHPITGQPGLFRNLENGEVVNIRDFRQADAYDTYVFVPSAEPLMRASFIPVEPRQRVNDALNEDDGPIRFPTGRGLYGDKGED
jgi:hypothetical protein